MNICMLWGGLFSTVDSNTLPLPWQLIAPKKAVKSSLFNVINYVCTHVDGIRYECTQKSVHKWAKKAKWGVGGGQVGAGGWDGPGRDKGT